MQLEPTNGKPRDTQRPPGAWLKEHGVTPPPGSFEESSAGTPKPASSNVARQAEPQPDTPPPPPAGEHPTRTLRPVPDDETPADDVPAESNGHNGHEEPVQGEEAVDWLRGLAAPEPDEAPRQQSRRWRR
jgi:hypothetical protein